MSAAAVMGNQMYGTQAPCPRCRMLVAAVRNSDGEFSCRICGGPVIVTTDVQLARSGREIQALQRVRQNRTRSKWFRAGSLALSVAAVFGAFSLAALLWLIQPGLFVTASLSIAMLAPVILAVLAWRHATALSTSARADYQQALQDVAEDVVRSRSTAITSSELGRILATTEAQTDALLAQLNTLDTVESQVTDDGEVVFAARPEQRLRVGPTEPEDELHDEFEFPSASAASRRQR